MDALKRRWWLGILALALSGCSTGSANVVIHTSPSAYVWLMVDSQAGRGHSHPFFMTSEAIAAVLKGVQVEDRDTITGVGILGSRKARPAFTQAEISLLAPYLIEALKKASPKDMATFYMVVGDANHQRGVTSGGLFIEENRHLHLTLANCRSIPRGGQDYTIAMEVDTSDEPMMPVSPHRFRVGFQPVEAWIKHTHAENQPSFSAYNSAYGDLAKSLVIDLDRLLDHQ